MQALVRYFKNFLKQLSKVFFKNSLGSTFYEIFFKVHPCSIYSLIMMSQLRLKHFNKIHVLCCLNALKFSPAIVWCRVSHTVCPAQFLGLCFSVDPVIWAAGERDSTFDLLPKSLVDRSLYKGIDDRIKHYHYRRCGICYIA